MSRLASIEKAMNSSTATPAAVKAAPAKTTTTRQGGGNKKADRLPVPPRRNVMKETTLPPTAAERPNGKAALRAEATKAAQTHPITIIPQGVTGSTDIPASIDRTKGMSREQIDAQRLALNAKAAAAPTIKKSEFKRPEPKAADPAIPTPVTATSTEEPAMGRKTGKKTAATTKSKARTAVKAATKTTPARAAGNGERNRYDWAGAKEKAAKGTMPAAPDFSANTHRYYRPALAEVVKLAKAGDLKGLQGYRVQGSSTSPNAIKKYRDLCIAALKVKAAA